MKEANLISVLNAYKSLSAILFHQYLTYHSISIKDDELDDLYELVHRLNPSKREMALFDKYFIGYSIPQIGKEFDLLRIDDKSIVNIELKSSSTEARIKFQLERNRYYLSFLKRKIYSFCYVSTVDKLYSIDGDENLVEVDFKELAEALKSQNVKKIVDIDSHFNPSNYLVSPFNSTQEFIKGNYFLTLHQEEIKSKVLREIRTAKHSIISIKGKAGTGKTLLTYDIAKEVARKKNVLIVHCGLLNDGHYTLIEDFDWNIVAIKFIMRQDLSMYDLIIIDEAQRIYQNQLRHIVKMVKETGNNCIFSYDGLQTLTTKEIQLNIEKKIESEITIKPLELTTKIRTNKEVASFIQCLIDKNKPVENYTYSNIELNYFNKIKAAKSFLLHKKSKNWKIINYTPSTVDTLPYEQHHIQEEKDNVHMVIGQEFDNVITVIDEYFCYKKGRLSTHKFHTKPHYHPTKMLFQILSRTRLRLGIVIINNPEVLSRCLEILKQS